MALIQCLAIFVVVFLLFKEVSLEKKCGYHQDDKLVFHCRGHGLTTFPNRSILNTATKKIEIFEANLTEIAFENITLPPMVTELSITRSRVKIVGKFKPHNNLLHLDLKENEISSINPGAFDNLPNLVYLNLKRNQLKAFPVFNRCLRTETLHLEGNAINELKPGQLQNLPCLKELFLGENCFQSIPDGFFTAEPLHHLNLENTPLRFIKENAFKDLTNLKKLNLDKTKIVHLPTNGLQNLTTLSVRGRGLRSIPSGLDSLQSIKLSVEKSYLCCKLFRKTYSGPNGPKTIIPVGSTCCPVGVHTTPNVSHAQTIPTGFGRRKRSKQTRVTLPPFDPSKPFVTLSPLKLVECDPGPTAFQPCENIMGALWLTVASFIVAPFALCGNFMVIVVFMCLSRHYNVSRFLVTNLAIADMCMGVYLLSLVVLSVSTSGEYYNHVERLQYGLSCKVLGFLAMFSSELSVFSLSLITVERYLTIVYAMYPRQRLHMRTAIMLMGVGWVVSISVALLPIFGVGSYSKVSICLPFEVDHGGKWYLLAVFGFNGLSFVFITVLYARIYYSVFLPSNASPSRGHDSRVARRMAILVFTDFACFAPIAVTGLAALFDNKLIGVTESKYLLVFFFPLNSFMNPFLYAIITKSFRRDLASLLKNCFVCGGTLTDYLTSLPGRTAQTNPDQVSRVTRPSLDFNTMDPMEDMWNVRGSRENPLSASFSKSEPNLVKFNHLALETTKVKTTES